ncbi:MAG: hypothetical protein M0033_12235, partial [Nitrospiraceae bacterium]|nr:hypothetical protein [Nitrospiraceae bacterium]
QLSGLFNADWHLVELLPQKGGDYLKLLKMKNGFNYLLMSDILFYYDRLMEIFGPRINFFTGDGGDRTITGFKPYRNLKRIEDLLDYTISTNRVFGLDEVSGLTGVPKDHITGELESHVSGYPERDFNHKYVHFMIYENAMNWVNEGTDRNRYYFRLQNPLWSIRLFDYALNCPDGQKSHYRLYREFFKRLSPRACAVNYANFNAPLTSKRLMMKLFIISKLPRGFKTAVKKRLDGHFRPHGANSSLSACLEDQINGCAPIGDFLSLSGIRGSIKNLNKVQLNVLFTLTSFMEELGGNGSTLERYKEAVLV